MKASSLLSTVGLCGALLAYSNADALLELRTQRLAPARLNPGHLAMLAFVLSWGWAERLTLRDLGLQIRGIGRSLGWGLAVGVVGSVAVAVFFAFPIVSRDAITHPEFRRLSFSRLMWMLCGQLLISTAAFEE